ncbi:hypothetical protein [Salinicoccus sp. HZC-1]|uniref:hypothetical protein n=1 Tax=Salinicoccus sp. HZC-1 TaxID=3385497 RepID=UPI00398B2CB3
MIHYLFNAYIGKNMIDGGLQKVQNEGEMGEDFEKEFDVNKDQMKIAGYLETIGSIFLFASFLGKTFTRVGTILLNIVLGVAIIKHLRAGHGFEGSKNALKLFGLNTVSYLGTFSKK